MTRTLSCLVAVCLVTSCQTTKPVKDATPAVAPVKKPEEAAAPVPVPETNSLANKIKDPAGLTQLPGTQQFQPPSNPAPTPGAPIRVVPPADPKTPQ